MAVLCGKELHRWGVTRFRHKDPKDALCALEKRLSRLVRLYRPTLLVAEQPSPARLKLSPCLNALFAQTLTTGKAFGLEIKTVDAAFVRKRLCGCKKAQRGDLARRVIETYPHLARYGDPKSRWQKEYWMSMFSAIAAGMACDKS